MARYDTAVGKYIYVTVDDLEYRVYFEESGSGTPLMLQHTAGSDAREWRHVLENKDITDNYRVIAYDLPYHANPCRRWKRNTGKKNTGWSGTSS